MKPLRVLHVTQGYVPAIGGTERLVQRLSEELVRQFGDEVTVFTTDCYSGEGFNRRGLPRMPVGWEERSGVRIRRFRVWSTLSRLFRPAQGLSYRLGLGASQHLRTLFQGPIAPGLGRAVRRHVSDVVAATSFPLLHMSTSLRAAGATGRPCVFYGGIHPDDDWGFGRPWIYSAIRRASRYVAYTDFEAAFVRSRGVAGDRIRVIPLAVDAELFGKTASEDARLRLGLPRRARVVGYIGQLGLHKGVDALLRAMPIVWRLEPEVRLMIAGARAAFAVEIERAVAGWPAEWREKTVLRYGFEESEKPALYAALDVFAYPSGYESFGIAFLEAWAAGLPVIGCRRGAIPDVVAAGRDGLLVPFQDEERLAEAILTLLRNEDWRRRLGEAGRRKVLGGLTWEPVARRFREVLAAEVR